MFIQCIVRYNAYRTCRWSYRPSTVWHEDTTQIIRTWNCQFQKSNAIIYRVPGEIKRSRDLRGGRWSWTLKLAQKRSWVGRWSWAEQVGPLLLRVVQVVRQQQCNGLCLCDCPNTEVETAIAQCTSRWAMARGHFHCSGGPRYLRSFSDGFRGRAFTLSSPSHSVPVPNKPSRFRGRKATMKKYTVVSPTSEDIKLHIIIVYSKTFFCLF